MPNQHIRRYRQYLSGLLEISDEYPPASKILATLSTYGMRTTNYRTHLSQAAAESDGSLLR